MSETRKLAAIWSTTRGSRRPDEERILARLRSSGAISSTPPSPRIAARITTGE
jgi:hypothetical protein